MVKPVHSSPSDPNPLHELIAQLSVSEFMPLQKKRLLPTEGTLQSLNQRLARSSIADFLNYTLRGVGQAIFLNNPISGALILLALWIQSPWVGAMGLLGAIASTLMALLLRPDRAMIRNGFFGYNGLLVGAALATFSDPATGIGVGGWAIAVLVFSAFSTLLMRTFGVWWAKTVKTPPLMLPFIIATLICLFLGQKFPQLGLNVATIPDVTLASSVTWSRLLAALPIGIGQVFFSGKLLSGLLIVLAIALCSPLGALVGLFGCAVGIWAGLLLGVDPSSLYLGLWGYNAVLCAMAIGGIFYVPNGKSIGIGAIAAFVAAILGGWLGVKFSTLGLPALTLSFCGVTIAYFMVLRRSLPSLVSGSLHAVNSPEEHRQQYRVAKKIIANFRLQLAGAIAGQRHFYLLDQASNATKGDLRYIFNGIDIDQSGTVSSDDLASHLVRANQIFSASDLNYLFSRIDLEGNGTVNFEEFGELMLRHRYLRTHRDAFITHFLPLGADGNDSIKLSDMNATMASVGERPLSPIESGYLKRQIGDQPMTWNRFIEMLLVT